MPPVAEPPVESPASLEEAYALLASGDGAVWRPMAGGTDLLVQITGELGPPPERVLDLWRLDELRGIERDGDALLLGALTTYTELRASRLIAAELPALAEAAATIGAAQIQNRGTIGGNVANASPAGDTLPLLLATDATIGAAQIQNRGTIGGNIANASPAGDTLPLLLATDATIVLGGPRGERSVAAADFFPAYRRTARADDELILRVRIPIPDGRTVRFRKVGTRRAQAISKVVMALAWRADGGAWTDVRVALGSVAATPLRAAATEAALEGARPSPEVADRASAALGAEIHPIDDVRSTADYRRAAATRVLHRLIREEGAW